ncbi:hypothetical protein ACJ41O_014251 [Fusarium nematophilum]
MSDIDKKLAEWEDLKKDLFRLLLAHISQQQEGVEIAIGKLMEQNRQLEMAQGEDLDKCKTEILVAQKQLKAAVGNANGIAYPDEKDLGRY